MDGISMVQRLALFVCGVLLAGCTNLLLEQTRPSCETILSTPLRSYLGEPVKLDDVFAVAENSYGIRRADVVVTRYQSQQNWDAEWKVNGIRTIVGVQNDLFSRVTVLPEEVHTTAGQVIECIDSQPEWYWAAYGPDLPERTGVRYTLQMWYPNIGLFTENHGNVRSAGELPDLSTSIAIDALIMVKPGSIKEVHDRVFYGLPLEQQPLVLRPRPWPGEWTNAFFIEERNYASW